MVVVISACGGGGGGGGSPPIYGAPKSWRTAQTIESNTSDAGAPQIAFDANNNAIALWSQGNDLYAARFTSITGVWPCRS
jgi:hypothetical protein